MKRDDKSKYLLYIEPSKNDKLENPIDDELTKLMEMALGKAEEGTASYSDENDDGSSFRKSSGYKGIHSTDCGMRSSNRDYLLENGMITNSLAPFYLMWYRYSIPESDMIKLQDLAKFYNKEI